MRALLRLMSVVLIIVVVAYLAGVGYLFFFQRHYVFHPSGALGEPAEFALAGVETTILTMRDGVELTAWHAPADTGKPTILYFHGNAGSLSDRVERFRQIRAEGMGLLAPSYRGFPGSGGSPSEKALFSDALETFDWLASRAGAIVLHGESLGTGIAAYVAAERSARALVLEAPYTAALDIAAEQYPWVPVSYLMRDPFLTREHLRRVAEPILVVHGTADRVIPVEHGQRVFEAASEPKSLVVIEGAGHSDLWERGLWPAALDFLRRNGVAPQPAADVRRMPSLAG